MNSYFVIVNSKDSPIFEYAKTTKDPSLLQFIAYASLDQLDEIQWEINNSFLKCIDKHGEWFVSGYLTSSSKFLLLHDIRNEENIKSFFSECHELYIKVTANSTLFFLIFKYILNPFYQVDSQIKCKSFDLKIELISKKYFGH